jgi:hypothetical protein
VNISAVKNEDGGEYECIAHSRAGQANHSARLNIYGLPYIRPMPTISTIAGKTLTIKCPSAGYPIDKIIWEKSKRKNSIQFAKCFHPHFLHLFDIDNVKLPTNM